MAKYVLVTGGVISGVGKGIIASSIGVLLQESNLRVTAIKIDPYLNVDSGTMSPLEHGEVFILDDGGEVDLDLGNYERFLDVTLNKDNNITSGKVYQLLLERERRGDYLGKTVQVVPHLTDIIQDWIARVGKIPVDGTSDPADICIIELGGVVGDVEAMPFVEALRMLQAHGSDNFCHIHVSFVPVLGALCEQKTKPIQRSVQEVCKLGLPPDLLVCRSTMQIEQITKEAISLYCDIPVKNIVNVYDFSNIWHLPLILKEQSVHTALMRKLNLKCPAAPSLSTWESLAQHAANTSTPVNIAIIVKYTGLMDSYLSVIQALEHACLAYSKKLVYEWIDSSALEEVDNGYNKSWSLLKSADGIVIPGGFGDIRTQGLILATKYAREKNIPFLGICLGMQIAVIEYARSVLGLADADSTEFNPATTNACIVYMPEVSGIRSGGTMRLGSRQTVIHTPNCLTAKLYGTGTKIFERHRHRYEVNKDMVDILERESMHFVGKDESGRRMEIVELAGHPFFVGVQFQPECKSRPLKPSPVFLGLVQEASKHTAEREPAAGFGEKLKASKGEIAPADKLKSEQALTGLSFKASEQIPQQEPPVGLVLAEKLQGTQEVAQDTELAQTASLEQSTEPEQVAQSILRSKDLQKGMQSRSVYFSEAPDTGKVPLPEYASVGRKSIFYKPPPQAERKSIFYKPPPQVERKSMFHRPPPQAERKSMFNRPPPQAEKGLRRRQTTDK